MSNYVPRGLEPHKKREILDQRIAELRHAIRTGATPARLSKTAERVRSAALAVIKAKRAILAEIRVVQSGGSRFPDGDSNARQEENLAVESGRCSSATVDEIAARYSSPNFSPGR